MEQLTDLLGAFLMLKRINDVLPLKSTQHADIPVFQFSRTAISGVYRAFSSEAEERQFDQALLSDSELSDFDNSFWSSCYLNELSRQT